MGYGLIDNNTLSNIANAIRYKTNSEVNYYPRDMARAINQIQSGGGFSSPVVFSISQFLLTDTNGMPRLENISLYNTANMCNFNFVNVLPGNATIIAKADWEEYSTDDVYLYSELDENNHFAYGLYAPESDPNTISILDMSYICKGSPYLQAPFCTPLTYKMDGAFKGCYNYNFVSPVCGKNVKYFRRTYAGCDWITESVCGNNVIDMTGAYSSCYRLVNGIIGPNVLYADEAFMGCGNMQRLQLGNSVTNISNLARDSYNLGNFNGGENVVNAANAFFNCGKLLNIVSLPNIVNASYLFYNCGYLDPVEAYNLLLDATHLEDASYMFYNCPRINKAFIPVSVNNVGCMFYGCPSLREVEFDMENINNYAFKDAGLMFKNCYTLPEPVHLPDSVQYMASTYQNCYSLNNYWFPNNIISIVDAFGNCYAIKNDVEIPETISSFGGAFYNCGLINNVAIFSTVLNDSSYAITNAFGRYTSSGNYSRRNIVLVNRNAYNTFLAYNGAGNWSKSNEVYDEPVEVMVNGKNYNCVRCSYNTAVNCYVYCTE